MFDETLPPELELFSFVSANGLRQIAVVESLRREGAKMLPMMASIRRMLIAGRRPA